MTEPPNDQPTFEQALAESQRIVHDLEDGAISLEESLARYEKGVGLLKRCYTQLQQAEQRIQLLAGTDDEDRPIARPFEHSAALEAEKPKKRKKQEQSDELF